jgi:hypothetical protein
LIDAVKFSQGDINCEVSQCLEAFVAAANDVDETSVRIVLMVNNGAHGFE